MNAATILGKPIAWTYAGKTYQVAERTLDQELAFQRHLEENELAGVRRHAEALGTDYGTALDNWQKGLGLHLYEFGSPNAVKAYCTVSGRKFAFALAISEGSGMQVQVALELMDRLFLDNSKEGQAAWKELQAIYDALNSPKTTAPAQEAPGQV